MTLSERGLRDTLNAITEARKWLRNHAVFLDTMEQMIQAQLKKLEAKDRV